MNYKHLILREEQKTAIITINRPEKLNALNFEVIEEITDAVNASINNTAVRAIIITGAGDKAFVAGADIGEIANLDPDKGKAVAENGQALMHLIENASKPVIACVNGYALGGGCELAMACHIRIAAENALFGQPEINLGIIPGYGGTQRLTQLIGKPRALELMLTAATISAEQALQFGLVNHVVAPTKLMNRAFSLIEKICNKPRLATSLIIQAANSAYQASGYETEANAFGECIKGGDFEEGANAFLQKRKPNFD